jgi:hypothetical protein
MSSSLSSANDPLNQPTMAAARARITPGSGRARRPTTDRGRTVSATKVPLRSAAELDSARTYR